VTIIHTATNDRADYETKTLGESWPAIRAAEEAYQAFVTALQAVQKANSDEADLSATEFLMALQDARSDSCWSRIVSDSQDAFTEARVRPIQRSAA